MNDIVTVKDLIDYLEKNYSRDTKLAFYDEGGAWIELVHVPISLIGDPGWMFNYVKDKKNHELKHLYCRNEDKDHMIRIINNSYKSVTDNDVVIF